MILGDILFNKLNIQEILAIIGHEFGHIKYIYKLVLSLFVIPLILAISTIIISPECNCITLFILFVSTFLTLFPFANRTSEYKADLESAKEIGAENLISALTKITSPEEHNREYITHPSINKRIRNLISYKTKSNSTSH